MTACILNAQTRKTPPLLYLKVQNIAFQTQKEL